jgi:hypothetical protein
MSSYKSLFSGVNFKKTITKYCNNIGWNIDDLSDTKATLDFEMESGRTQRLYIIRYDTTLEFSVPSMYHFENEDEVPHFISTILMRKNSAKKIGFWCIEEISDELYYSVMHNAEIELINEDYFATVIRTLINDCDEFETTVEKMNQE